MIDISELRSRVDLLALCPDVKPAGKGKWRGKCPLCNVRTGFSVYTRHGDLVWHCFGCARGGDSLDMFGLLNNLTMREVIGKFRGGTETLVTSADRVARIADADRASQGKYILCCACCPRTLELADDLEVALALKEAGHAQNWSVAPDGDLAVCWDCLAKHASEKLDHVSDRASEIHRTEM